MVKLFTAFKSLFDNSYDFDQLLHNAAFVMSANIELRPLVSRTLETLCSQMKLNGAMLILVDQNGIYDQISIGLKSPILKIGQIAPLLDKKEVVLLEKNQEDGLKQLNKDFGVFATRILAIEERVTGLLVLGKKQNNAAFGSKDLKAINTLAPYIAVAVQNSQSFEKIKKFNLILSDEIRKATSDLQKANSKLKDLDKLKDDFVSIASHELRTPMTAIRSYAWMALHRSDIKLSERMRRYLYRTLISTERLINLVNDLLNISRIEGGKIEVSPIAFDLSSLVKDVAEDVKVKADEKQLKLFVLDHPNLPKVFADPDKVREVLLNLIGNSIKFTYPNGTITVDFFADGQYLEVSIKDTGSGISKEDLGRLFQKFGRLENSYVSMSTSGGTGLGLYISKSLVDLMHGKIWANSEGVDQGAAFTFSLPIASLQILQNAERFHIRPSTGEAKPLEPVAI